MKALAVIALAPFNIVQGLADIFCLDMSEGEGLFGNDKVRRTALNPLRLMGGGNT